MVLLLFSPTLVARVTAWMFAKITRLSSLAESSRQLFKFVIISSSVNYNEHGPSFGPFEHPQPSSINFFTFLSDRLSSSSAHSVVYKSSPSIFVIVLWMKLFKNVIYDAARCSYYRLL